MTEAMESPSSSLALGMPSGDVPASSSSITPPPSGKKRSADVGAEDDQTLSGSKKSRIEVLLQQQQQEEKEGTPASLPAFPVCGPSWREEAQALFSTLPEEHRPAFAHLISSILSSGESTAVSSSSSPPVSSHVAAAPPPPPAAVFDRAAVVHSFLDLSFLTPRGKFDLLLTAASLILTNSKLQQTSIIPLSSLLHALCVPDGNKRDLCVVLDLARAQAITVGKARHSLLAFRCEAKSSVSSRFLSAISSLSPATRIDSASPVVFSSSTSLPFVSCYHGTSDGELYPLPSGLLFIRKPLLFIAVADVDGLSLSRGNGGGKTFDLGVGVKTGRGRKAEQGERKGKNGSEKAEEVFAMIGSAEQSRVEQYAEYVKKCQKKQAKEEASAAGSGPQQSDAATQRSPAVPSLPPSSSSSSSSSPFLDSADSAALGQERAAPAAVSAADATVVSEGDSDSEADSDFAPDDDSGDEQRDSSDSEYHSGDLDGEVSEAADEDEEDERPRPQQRRAAALQPDASTPATVGDVRSGAVIVSDSEDEAADQSVSTFHVVQDNEEEEDDASDQTEDEAAGDTADSALEVID